MRVPQISSPINRNVWNGILDWSTQEISEDKFIFLQRIHGCIGVCCCMLLVANCGKAQSKANLFTAQFYELSADLIFLRVPFSLISCVSVDILHAAFCAARIILSTIFLILAVFPHRSLCTGHALFRSKSGDSFFTVLSFMFCKSVWNLIYEYIMYIVYVSLSVYATHAFSIRTKCLKRSWFFFVARTNRITKAMAETMEPKS